MDMRIPPLNIQIALESNPLKSTMLVGRLGVSSAAYVDRVWLGWRADMCIYIYIYVYIHTHTGVCENRFLLRQNTMIIVVIINIMIAIMIMIIVVFVIR